MPASFWVPLAKVNRTVPSRLLHAAFSGWFDGDEQTHRDNVKPYSLAPLSVNQGVWGIEIATMTDEAEAALLFHARNGAAVRLGSLLTPVGLPACREHRSWEDLAAPTTARSWTISFLTPTTFRSGNHASPVPNPGVLLRAPADVWHRFGQSPAPRVAGPDHDALWLSRAEIETVDYDAGGRVYPGALGWVTMRCDDDEVAAKVSALLGLAAFCGVGSFRGKGMGVVDVTPN